MSKSQNFWTPNFTRNSNRISSSTRIPPEIPVDQPEFHQKSRALTQFPKGPQRTYPQLTAPPTLTHLPPAAPLHFISSPCIAPLHRRSLPPPCRCTGGRPVRPLMPADAGQHRTRRRRSRARSREGGGAGGPGHCCSIRRAVAQACVSLL